MKILLVAILFLTSCASRNLSDSSSTGTTEFQLRPYRTVELDNGLKIYFIEDPTLPRVSFQLLIRTGLYQEPKGRAGLNAMTATLLEQGTRKRTAPVIAEELGQLGTEFSASPGMDFTFLSADSLSRDRSKLLEVFGDIVMNPSFNASEVERVRSRFRAHIAKKIDNPSGYANDQFEEFLYGAHPYGRDTLGNLEDLKKIRKADIIKHYLSWYRPNNAALAVIGQFPKDFEIEVTNVFKSWEKRPLKTIEKFPTPQIEGINVKVVSKAGLQQTQIRMGQIGVERNDPDFLILRATNEILGGGMSSRLMQRVRDQLGLTYGISSGFDFRKDKGSFVISTFTKNESVGQTLKETIDVYNQFVANGVTDAELRAAKAQMIGQFPRALETADRYAYNLLVLDYYGVPFSYLTDYMKNVEKISVSDVNRAIKKHLSVNDLKILVYGDESQILKQLESYKPIVERVKAP